MRNNRLEYLNIGSEDSLVAPAELKKQYPLTEKSIRTVARGRATIKDILNGKDPRLFAVVGPCSIHDVEAAREYARRLRKLADEVENTLVLVMRVYFEKPRTRVGWQGLINDPRLDGSGKIEEGLHLARRLLLDIAELGLPTAGEALDVISPRYLQDLVSWTAIGARTAESQTHRRMASGLSSAVGFKNATDGNMSVAINAMHCAANPSSFLSVNPGGRAAVIHTTGNRNTHIVLRGGGGRVNYDAASIAICEKLLAEAGFPKTIMVDCSHGNSQGEPARQPRVLSNITSQILAGNRSIVGMMIESNLEWGKQPIPKERRQLKYGVSVTDGCIGWETTEKILRETHDQLRHLIEDRRRLVEEAPLMHD